MNVLNSKHDLNASRDSKSPQRPAPRHELPLAPSPSRMLARFQPLQESKSDVTTTTPRRTTHGGCAWSLPSRDGSLALRQPQDGALTNAAHSISATMLSALRSRPSAASTQASDDKLTGATRSLASRILGLNGMKPLPRPVLDADTERYFAEHSPKLKRESIRKGPDGSRAFTRIPSPQTNVA
jgi:hypothetical protein